MLEKHKKTKNLVLRDVVLVLIIREVTTEHIYLPYGHTNMQKSIAVPSSVAHVMIMSSFSDYSSINELERI